MANLSALKMGGNNASPLRQQLFTLGRGLEYDGNTLQRSGDTLVKKHTSDTASGNYTTSSTTAVPLSDEMVFTPASATSVFDINLVSDIVVYAPSAAQNDYRAQLTLSYYRTSTAAWVALDTTIVGALNAGNNGYLYCPLAFRVHAASGIVADQNPATQIRLRLTGYTNFANNEMLVYAGKCFIDEYEAAS